MPRLALAIIVAFTLHVLLLMTVVPKPRMQTPEFKGSGQVTVSIIRSIPQTESIEDVKVQDSPAAIDEPEQFTQVIPENVPQESPEEQEILDQKTKEQEEKPEESEKSNFVKPKARRKISDKSKKEVPEQNKVQQKANEDLFFSSDVESLQDPKPVQHSNRPPTYPALARKRGWEGTVILEVDIRSDGMVKSIEIKKSSSYEMLDKEAMRAVKKWHFLPGSKDGKVVDMKVLVPVQFVLKEQ